MGQFCKVVPDRTSSGEYFAFLNAFICMLCVLLTCWKLKVSVLAISSRVNCIINSQAVKRQGMAGIHAWAFTFSQAQHSIVCVPVPDKTLSIYQKCHLFEEKQVMVGRDLSLWRLDIHRWQTNQYMGGVLFTKLWVIALYKAFLQLWHIFMYVNFFCSFFFSLSLTCLSSHPISCFCV